MLEGVGASIGGNNIVNNVTKSRLKIRKTRLVRIPENIWRRIKLEAIKNGITMSKLLEKKLK